MKSWWTIIGWIAAGIAGFLLATWAFPRAFPLFPQQATISRSEAKVVALERLRDLGELPENPYIVVELDGRAVLEHHLQPLLASMPAAEIRASRLGRDLLAWEITVWKPGARTQDWSYRARIGPQGEVNDLRLRFPPEEEGGEIFLRQPIGEAALQFERDGELVSFCRFKVKKDRIVTVTVTAFGRRPRCKVRD